MEEYVLPLNNLLSLLGKILEEYVLALNRDIFSKQCLYLNFSNQPMRYVTDNYLLHTLINNIYIYLFILNSLNITYFMFRLSTL